MFRILGFLIGSAVSLGAMVLFLGIPEFHLANPQLDKGRFDEALDKLRDKSREIEQVAIETLENVSTPDDPVANEVATAPVTAEHREPAPAPDPEWSVDDEEEEPVSVSLASLQTMELEPHWHSFWNPFRSEIAARGFVSQLEKVTGLDYRVVKVKTGVYQVAFAYGDDQQRQVYLSQISAATGLELPGI